jgi:hypothetical protein
MVMVDNVKNSHVVSYFIYYSTQFDSLYSTGILFAIDQVFTDQNQLTRTRLGLGIREYEYLHCTRSTILQVPGHWNPSPMRCTTVVGQMTPTPTPTR